MNTWVVLVDVDARIAGRLAAHAMPPHVHPELVHVEVLPVRAKSVVDAIGPETLMAVLGGHP